jgi:hypothetical protein
MDPDPELSHIQSNGVSNVSTLDFIETRFGVELEVCVKLSPDCIRGRGLSQFENIMSFKDKFDAFYRSILVNSPTFSEIAEEYEYLVLNEKTRTGTKHYFYTLQNPSEGGIEYSQLAAKIDASLSVNPKNELYQYKPTPGQTIAEQIFKQFQSYEYPIVEEDLSIRCGDTKGVLEKEEAGILDPFSFRFECITPIVSIKGNVTPRKLRKAIVPLLFFFGFHKPSCFLLNYSMGFHVNASLFIPSVGKYIAIGKPPFLNQLLRKYIPMERTLYKAVRTRKPRSANITYTSRFARPLYGNLNRFMAESPALSMNEVLNTKMVENEYIEEKYKAIKRKSPFLLEFRLFEGESNLDLLIERINTALTLLHSVAQSIVATSGPKGLSLVNPSSNRNEYEGGSRKKRSHTRRRHTRKRG